VIGLYIVVFALAAWGMSFKRHGFYDALARETTAAIKGIFIALVFVSHISGYVDSLGYSYASCGGKLFLFLKRLLGQLIVVMFLFYSGYGVMMSARHKGRAYVAQIPKRRILTTVLNFDVAVLVFVLAGWLSGMELSWRKIGLSLIGWESVGNSNWYIFVIVLCYGAAWLSSTVMSMKVGDLGGGGALCSIIVLCIGLILSFVKPVWWYNTIMAFSFGCLYAEYKEKIERRVQQHYRVYCVATFSLLIVLMGILKSTTYGGWHNLLAIVFAFSVVIFSMKIKVGNRCLFWMGINLFPLYIYQRLPMRLCLGWFSPPIGEWQCAFYVAICIVATVAVAMAYKKIKITLG